MAMHDLSAEWVGIGDDGSPQRENRAVWNEGYGYLFRWRIRKSIASTPV